MAATTTAAVAPGGQDARTKERARRGGGGLVRHEGLKGKRLGVLPGKGHEALGPVGTERGRGHVGHGGGKGLRARGKLRRVDQQMLEQPRRKDGVRLAAAGAGEYLRARDGPLGTEGASKRPWLWGPYRDFVVSARQRQQDMLKADHLCPSAGVGGEPPVRTPFDPPWATPGAPRLRAPAPRTAAACSSRPGYPLPPARPPPPPPMRQAKARW